MEHRNRIPVRNGGVADLVVVVEPWASEIRLAPGAECEVVQIGNARWPSHSVELCPYGLIFFAKEGTDAHEIWQGGQPQIW